MNTKPKTINTHTIYQLLGKFYYNIIQYSKEKYMYYILKIAFGFRIF